uniref:Uncharacterized protein n=1 Tax=mine drainage metagenome TaxID=410659 RepID=E6QIR0_9ZZZZ
MTRFSEVCQRGDGRLRGKRKHPGSLALLVAVNDHSRMAFTQMLPDQKAGTTIGFLNSAVQFFARHGIGVRALLTDNGSSYRLLLQPCFSNSPEPPTSAGNKPSESYLRGPGRPACGTRGRRGKKGHRACRQGAMSALSAVVVKQASIRIANDCQSG